MLLWLLRGCYLALLIGMAFYGFSHYYLLRGEDADLWSGVKAVLTILAVGGLILFTDLWERNKQITTISAVYFGLLLGLLLGSLFTLALEPFLKSWFPGRTTDSTELSEMAQLARFLITVVCCYVSISTLLQTKDEFRFIIPYVEFSKQVKGGKPLVLDTSVIIDGRIADICDTRIVDTKLIVPRFVLQELQMHDGNLVDLRDANGEKIRVDERLVLFTKAIGGRVVTNDFNLNKIAQLQGVDVINLNEVANSLKTVALPGELMNVRVVKPGDQPGQGVAYLDDGTMVVVEMGRAHIGVEVAIQVTSVLQTPAGRMIFGKVERPIVGTNPTTNNEPPKTENRN